MADKFTVFADKLSIPTSLPFATRRRHRPPGAAHAVPQGHRRRRQGRRAQGAVHAAGAPATRTPGRATCTTASTTGSTASSATPASTAPSAASGTRFRQGFFRFKPDGSKLEFLRNTNNNTWGVGFSEEGLLFGSTANGNPSVYLPIPNRYYETGPRLVVERAGRASPDNARFDPITDKVRQVDWHGGFTAAAGHALYTARTYPQEYWNRTAFVTEPTGHLVGDVRAAAATAADFTLAQRAGTCWPATTSGPSPIMAEVGPDGNVWVIDWYNFIVQHNPTPRRLQDRQGQRLRDRPARQEARPHLPARLQEGEAGEAASR